MEIIKNNEKLSLIRKKESRVRHSTFLILFNFLSILIFAASLGIKSVLFYQLKDKKEYYFENYNMFFNSLQAMIFGLDPLMIIFNIISLVLIFYTQLKRKNIWKCFELVLFLFLCSRILVGIMFLAGNDSFCKRALDSFDGANILEISEDIYYILKSVWIDEIISIILLFLISGYFLCKIIRSYQDKNPEYDWKFICFALSFCLIIIVSFSLKIYLWSLLDNANFYLENFPAIFKSLSILLVVDPLMIFLLIIILIYRVIKNISFEIKSSDLILFIIFTIFSMIKLILALLIVFGDDGYCQNTIKNSNSINDQGSFLNFLSANWNFAIFEITIYGIFLLIANFSLLYLSYEKIEDDNLKMIYTSDSINYILSSISLILTLYFWSNSPINELLLEKFETTFQSFRGIIILNIILIVTSIVFTFLNFSNFTEEEKLFKVNYFVLFPFAIARIILSIIFLVGDYSSILELIIINSNNEISQNLLKINFQYEIFYLVFITMQIFIQIAKFLIGRKRGEMVVLLIIFIKIFLSLVFVAYFLSSIKNSEIFSKNYDVLFKSAQGILITNILILCFIIGIIAKTLSYDNYDFRENKETIYGCSFIVLIVFYVIKLILAVTFLKGCNYEWEISNELLNSNTIALSFEESLKILFIYQIIELSIYAFIFAFIIIVLHLIIFFNLFEYYREEKTVFTLAIFVNYALTIISLGISTAFWDKVMANDYLIETYPTTFRSFEGIIGMDAIIIFVFFIFYLLKIINKEDIDKEDEDKFLSVFVAILMILLTIRIILGIIFMVADDYFINDWIDSPNPEKYGSLDLQAKLKTQWQFEIFYLVSLLPIGIAILISLAKFDD